MSADVSTKARFRSTARTTQPCDCNCVRSARPTNPEAPVTSTVRTKSSEFVFGGIAQYLAIFGAIVEKPDATAHTDCTLYSLNQTN